MKRDEFITKLAVEINETKARTKEILVAFESAVVETVKDNDFVPFTFGKIGGKTRAAKTCRNPQTGETMEVPEKVGYPYAKFSSTIK